MLDAGFYFEGRCYFGKHPTPILVFYNIVITFTLPPCGNSDR